MDERNLKETSEATRILLNRCIDLLHKVANKKLEVQEAKKDVKGYLENYFLGRFDHHSMRGKVRFQSLLEKTGEIIEELSLQKLPLYEAIMQMNRAIIEIFQNVEKEDSFEGAEFDVSGELAERQLRQMEKHVFPSENLVSRERPSYANIPKQLAEILELKEKLESRMIELNEVLSSVGFELKSVAK